jgi:serine/threonine protein kinase
MAPESILEGRFTPASDLFALGATLYAAVEGRHPFHDLSASSIVEAVKTDDPPEARHAGHLRPLIDGLLTKDPAARWDLVAAQHYLSRRPVQSPPDLPMIGFALHPSGSGEPGRRNRCDIGGPAYRR